MTDHYLNSSFEKSRNKIDFDLFNQWSKHLSPFLEKPSPEVFVDLVLLFECYQKEDSIIHILELLDTFPLFPGYHNLGKGDFFAHVHFVCDYFSLTRNKVLPKVPVISIAKSGSSFINTVMHRLFDMRPSVISFKHRKGVRAWVNTLAKCGGITHDHYFPTPENLKLLYDAGIKKCIIHSRHPVETFVSAANHYLDNDIVIDKSILTDQIMRTKLLRDYIDSQIDFYFEHFALWKNIWRNEAKVGNLEIFETQYADMKKNQLAFFKHMLSFYDVPYDESKLMEILVSLNPETAKNQYNFRKASHNEWQDVLTDTQIKKIKDFSIEYEFHWDP